MKTKRGPSKETRISRSDVSALLAPVVGQERATAVVHAAALGLGLGEDHFTEEQVTRILNALSRSTDLLGLAARRALTKRAEQKAAEEDPERPPASSGARPAPRDDNEVHAAQLVDLLTPALGSEKAGEVVKNELRRARLGETMTPRQAMGVLDALAMLPGIVGVTARFAKARFLLR